MKTTRRSKRSRKKGDKIKGLLFFIIFVAVSAVAGVKFFSSNNSSLTTFLSGGKTAATETNVNKENNTQSSAEIKTEENKKEEVKKEDNKVKEIKAEETKTEDKAKETKVEENKPKEEPVKKEQPSNNENKEGKKKIAYLTFDDGPSYKITPQILDILKENNIKATFFVIGSMAEENPSLLKREKAEGHVIANHTYSHDYNKIYSSTSNFIKDLNKGDAVVTSIIGQHDSKLIRFPGGSFGRTAYKQAVTNAGYHYVDWNALNGDAEAPHVSKEKLVARFKETAAGQNTLYILMHDAPGKQSTVQALPEIIEYLRAEGYEFRTLQ